MVIKGKVKKSIKKQLREQGFAEVDLTLDQIQKLHLINDDRGTDRQNDRFWRLVRAIRDHGYASSDPLHIFYLDDSFVLVDGGHRLSAARKVAEEWLSNLFREKVHYISCLVTPGPLENMIDSNRRVPAE
ncbi:hypothetical protein [Nisaea sp.]|uniref:hypothetical protein n=1 Tax=Nisaea sp. TaxID=2024842 RepID=UPI003B51A478